MNTFLINTRPKYYNSGNLAKEARVRRAELELDCLIRGDAINCVMLGEIYAARDGRYYYEQNELEQMSRC